MKKEGKKCIFCSIIENKSATAIHWIAENDSVVALYDIKPLSKGHLLIISKKHYKNLLKIKKEDWNAIFPVFLEVTRKIANMYSPKGFNFISNIGKEAFQSIEHFHFHLIPKYKKKEGFLWTTKID